MKSFSYLVAFLLSSAPAVLWAQEDTPSRLMKALRAEVTDIAIDPLDNIYLLTATNGLKKLNAAGDSIGVYNEAKRFGKVYSIDVSNPLKLLLYYKDFSTVVILDRLLSVRSSLNLRQHNIIQASAVSLSYDNNIWLFDDYENKLKKVDEEGKLLLQTDDFRMLFTEPVRPQQIIDQNELVYVYDTAGGLFIFDHYGTFKKKMPITGWKNITVMDKYITGIVDNHLLFYNTATLLQTSRMLPAAPAPASYMTANKKLFSWSKDSLQIYTIPF